MNDTFTCKLCLMSPVCFTIASYSSEFLGEWSLFVVRWCIIRIWQLGTILLETYSMLRFTCCSYRELMLRKLVLAGLPTAGVRGAVLARLCRGSVQGSCVTAMSDQTPQTFMDQCNMPTCILVSLRKSAELYTNYTINVWDSWKGKCLAHVRKSFWNYRLDICCHVKLQCNIIMKGTRPVGFLRRW